MADKYWVQGTGNWSDDDNHWATISGGSPSDGNIPTSSDNVIFDGNSGVGIVTQDYNPVGTGASCLDFNIENSSILTFALSAYIKIYGNFIGKSGVTITGSELNFQGTGAVTIKTNGLDMPSVRFGAAGTFTFQDNWTQSASTMNIVTGTLNFGSYTYNLYNIVFVAALTATLNFGSSTLNIRTMDINTNGFTVNCGTSTINLTDGSSIELNTYTWYNIVANGGSFPDNPIVIANGVLGGTTIINSFTITPGSGVNFYSSAKYKINYLSAQGTLTDRIEIFSDPPTGQAPYVTANLEVADGVFEYIDFYGPIQSGAAAPFTGTDTHYLSQNTIGTIKNEWDVQGTGFTSQIAVNDTRYAMAGAATTNNEHSFLKFNIPVFTGKEIYGIEVYVRAKDMSGLGTTWTLNCQLSWDAGVHFTEAKTLSWSETDDTLKIYGTPYSKWGHAWTLDEMTNDNFLVLFTVTGGIDSKTFGINDFYVVVNITDPLVPDTNFFELEGKPMGTGVYTLGAYSVQYPQVLDLTYPISERDGTDLVLDRVEIGSLLVDGNDLYVTWKRYTDTANYYGIDKLDYNNKLSGAFWESRIVLGNRSVFGNFSKFVISYAELPDGCDITLQYSKDFGTTWITMTTINDTQRKLLYCEIEYEATFTQYRLVITATSNDTPAIERADIILR